jgi:hypothetical protein
MSSAWRKWRTPLALSLALACSTGNAAMAQFYFRPFVQTFRYDLPPPDVYDDDYDAPRFASRRAIARILAREGFQLVGPLGRRGDQIVATGVNPREGETRFFIDPFEGVILHAVTLGAPPPRRGDGFVPPVGGSHPVVRDIGRDRGEPPAQAQDSDRVRRAARAPEESPTGPAGSRREAARPLAPPAPIAAPAPKAAPKPAAVKPVEMAKPAEPAKPIEWAKPAEISKPVEPPKAVEALKPVEAAKPIATKPAETAKAPEPARVPEPKKPLEAKGEPLAKPAPAPVTQAAKSQAPLAKAPAPRATAARSTGGSHRAIVPPSSSEGVTAVTPSAPATSTAHSAPGVRTPQSVAMPKEP